jgi:hypothetical protein
VLLGPFGAGRPVAELDDGVLRVGMGALGSARIPVEMISDVGTLRWPWWGGLGVRIARGMTAFVATSGPAVFIDLSEPVSVRAPLKWPTRKIALGVEDVEGLIAALVEARGGALHRSPEAP